MVFTSIAAAAERKPNILIIMAEPRQGLSQTTASPVLILSTLDADGDEKVSESEARGALKENFARIDRNGDGGIDLGELETILAMAAGQNDSGSSSASDEDVADQFVGAFKLASYVAYDQDGRETPTPYRDGLIMYDATGHMSVHLMHGDRDRPQGPLTNADRAAMYSSYIAYYGSYTARVSKGVVEHHVDGSLIPSLVGTTQIRHFAFEDDGDTLILMVKNGDRVQGRLRWERYR